MSSSYLRGCQFDDVVDFLFLTIDCVLFRLATQCQDLIKSKQVPDPSCRRNLPNCLKTLIEAMQRCPDACDAIVKRERALPAQEREWEYWLKGILGACQNPAWGVCRGSMCLHGLSLAVALRMTFIDPKDVGLYEAIDLPNASDRINACRAFFKTDLYSTAAMTYCCVTCGNYWVPDDSRLSSRESDVLAKQFKVCSL